LLIANRDRIDEKEAARTETEPQVMEILTFHDIQTGNFGYEEFVYHHSKNNKYVGPLVRSHRPESLNDLEQLREIERRKLYVQAGMATAKPELPRRSAPLQVLCSGCNVIHKCVRDECNLNYNQESTGWVFWLGAHSNCPKFPYHPTYDVDEIYGHLNPRRFHYKIGAVRYLED
jgi:hypothetical protein